MAARNAAQFALRFQNPGQRYGNGRFAEVVSLLTLLLRGATGHPAESPRVSLRELFTMSLGTAVGRHGGTGLRQMTDGPDVGGQGFDLVGR